MLGAKVTTMPGLMIPVSTRPTGTVPIPPILYTSNSEDSGLSHEQMKAIFPLGAPEAFQPFQPSRCIYNIVESPDHCLPVAATNATVGPSSFAATPLVAEA